MITKNYIKMCEQAEEIQKKWKPKIGDTINHRTWLPTQEQLQGMVLKNIDDLEVSFTNKDEPAIESNIWLKKDGKWDGFEPLFADDWNSLWLQICMLIKHNKTWTGEKWEFVDEH